MSEYQQSQKEKQKETEPVSYISSVLSTFDYSTNGAKFIMCPLQPRSITTYSI